MTIAVRTSLLAVLVILAAMSASCAHITGKVVAGKETPNILVADDGSLCVVSKERFEKTEIGMKALCAWRGGGRVPQPGF